MKKIAWIVILMIWLVLAVIGNAEETRENDLITGALLETIQQGDGIKETDLYAQAAVLMDAESGRVLFGKNEDQILAMASTTKIMTCIIALENAAVTDRVAVSSYASGMPEVKLGIRKGEHYQLNDLLHSLMLESHNDAAVAIAEHVGKQFLPEQLKNKSVSEFTPEESRQAVAAFADLMNDKAEELNCDNTWFITPNGLDAEERVQQENGEYLDKFHSTTAKELAAIMSYCILDSPKAEQFLAITRTSTHTISGENGRVFACYNHNAFLNMMAGAISGKTGFTNRAGYCYVGALENDGRTFVVALLACGWPYNKNYKWADTRKLMKYGVDNYYYRSFLDEEIIFNKKWLEPIPVADGQTAVLGDTAYVQVAVKDAATDSDVMQLDGLLMKAGEEIAVEYKQEKMLTAPVKEGTVIGNIRYMVEGITYRQEEIVTTESVERIDWIWCLEQILDRFLLNEQYAVK